MRKFVVKSKPLVQDNAFSDKFDIIVQGKYYDFTSSIVEEYLNLPFVNKVIVSCWEDDFVDIESSDRTEIIKNKYPEISGNGNRNYQIISSLSGLKRSTSKYSIKIRSDQKYTCESMIKMYNFFISNYINSSQVIFVSGIYPDLLFHPRDHVFWGETSSLINLFDIPIERNGITEIINIPKENLGEYYDCFIRTETYLGSHYCARFDSKIYRMILKSSEYLYDNAPKWNDAKIISDNITFKIFKSFPKNLIDFNWLGKTEWNIPGIPWTLQPYLDSCFWNEDGY